MEMNARNIKIIAASAIGLVALILIIIAILPSGGNKPATTLEELGAEPGRRGQVADGFVMPEPE